MTLEEFVTKYKAVYSVDEGKQVIREYIVPWLEDKFGKGNFVLQIELYRGLPYQIVLGSPDGGGSYMWANKICIKDQRRWRHEITTKRHITTSHIMIEEANNFETLIKDMMHALRN